MPGLHDAVSALALALGQGDRHDPRLFLAVSVQALRVLYDLLPEVDFIVCQFAPGHYRSSGNMA